MHSNKLLALTSQRRARLWSKLSTCCGCFLLLVLVVISASAQTPASASVTGSAILANTASSLGWASARSLGGVVAQGTLTRVAEDGTEFDPTTVTMEVRSDRRLRIELGSGGLTVISDGLGWRKSGTSTPAYQVLPHVAVSSWAPYFPFLADFAATTDPDITITNTATGTINGEPVVGVALKRSFSSTAQFRPARELSSALTLWVSQTTGLPVRADFVRLAIDNWSLAIPCSLYYSNWQAVSGTLVPMQIDEGTDKQVFLRYRFTSVVLNGSIPSTDFSNSPAGGTN